MALALVNPGRTEAGSVLDEFPPSDSPLRLAHFFKRLYICYDERFIVSAPRLGWITRRIEWSPNSPAFDCDERASLDYDLRLAT